MVSRENGVIAGCIALAVLLVFALDAVITDPPSWAFLLVLLGGGVLVPTLINESLADRES